MNTDMDIVEQMLHDIEFIESFDTFNDIRKWNRIRVFFHNKEEEKFLSAMLSDNFEKGTFWSEKLGLVGGGTILYDIYLKDVADVNYFKLMLTNKYSHT